jgi:hypothetical protein
MEHRSIRITLPSLSPTRLHWLSVTVILASLLLGIARPTLLEAADAPSSSPSQSGEADDAIGQQRR